MDEHPPKGRDTIIEETELYVDAIQEDRAVIKNCHALFFLHLSLIKKLIIKNDGKLCEDDVITVCYECIEPAARRYDVAKGQKRFTWVSFYMQRCQWAINEYFFRTVPIVYTPKEPYYKGLRFDYVGDGDLDSITAYDEPDDSYMTRWDAVYNYEINMKPFTEDEKDDIKFFKLHYLNKNITKIAKREGVSRRRVQEGIDRITEQLRLFYEDRDDIGLFY